ncbi:MAG: T9SS type A sorting domain-containing protein [Ignavibacteria bacterium]|nr:T9SS type A sorting domain-containing protein [Ignavibacteria bacterium]
MSKIEYQSGDTQTIVFAQIVSQGINNLNSVTKLKQTAAYVKNVFDNNFTTVDIKNNAENFSPDGFKLSQNFPNPFNPETVISYGLPVTGFVKLSVYDILGNEVAELVNEKQYAGRYEVKFDGSNIASGVYFYKLTAGKFSETE